MTEDELEKKIDELKSDNGGWSKESLVLLGVSWPPKKGWKKELLKKIKADR